MTLSTVIYMGSTALLFLQNYRLWSMYQAARTAGQKYSQRCAYYECQSAHFESMTGQAIESLKRISHGREDAKIQAQNTIAYMEYRTEKFDEGMKRWASLNPELSENLNELTLKERSSEFISTTNLQ